MKKTLLLLLASLTAMMALLLPTLGSGATQTVRVREVDGKISLSARPKAGVVRFVVRNAGGDEHNFGLRGGGNSWATRVLAGGGSATITAKLRYADFSIRTRSTTLSREALNVCVAPNSLA